MKIQLSEKYIMNIKMQRDILPWKAILKRVNMCAPPGYRYLNKSFRQSERMSLCFLKGSLTVEAAFVVPFFLMILLASFSFFSQYASAAKLQVSAAAEARKIGVSAGSADFSDSGNVTISKTKKLEDVWINPFYRKQYVVQSATCRAWIGFTELGIKETYVYITPEGSVYHLSADCTHLDLSIQQVTIVKALSSKNEYGEKYSRCEVCEDGFGALVYITLSGNRYHSQRNCSGLKRTIRQVPLKDVENRSCCIRCVSKEE